MYQVPVEQLVWVCFQLDSCAVLSHECVCCFLLCLCFFILFEGVVGCVH